MQHRADMAPERARRMRKSQICPGAFARAGHIEADAMLVRQCRKLRRWNAQSDFMAEVFDIPPAKPEHQHKLG